MNAKRRMIGHALGEMLGAVLGMFLAISWSVFPASAQIGSSIIAEAKAPGLQDMAARRPAQETSGQRWMKFESEYGIRQKSSWHVVRAIQQAKYGLDTLAFTAQETARRLEYTYDIGETPPNGPGNEPLHPQYALPLFGNFGHAQIKTVVTEHDPQTRSVFAGLKLVIPFGRGG